MEIIRWANKSTIGPWGSRLVDVTSKMPTKSAFFSRKFEFFVLKFLMWMRQIFAEIANKKAF
ncbi:hypothetical protein DWB84_07365 [Saccharophagus sp. K07]|nr:hypothetical protein [Saccharophagus sp. K07]